MEKDILLTITMLVSNREETIEKCMKSIKHLLDTVPSELIVVDTAENKVCMDIVRQYTDKIVRFEWCDDFGAARNAGLTDARGRWVMFLDDDEWFESTEDLEHFFLSGDYKKYNRATYKQRNYRDFKSLTYTDFTASRLAKRVKGICFKGKIHEFLTPMRQPIYHSSDYVHHYGYVLTPEESLKHSRRNIMPLLEMLREDPDDYHAMAQLLQEYRGRKEYFAAGELARRMCSTADCWTHKQKIKFTTYAAVIEIKLLLQQKFYQDAYDAGKIRMAESKCTPLAKVCICKLMMFACTYLEKYDEALEYIDRFYPLLKKWEDYPEQELLNCFAMSQELLAPEDVEALKLLKLHIYVQKKDWAAAQSELLAFTEQDQASKLLPFTVMDVVLLLSRLEYKADYIKAVKKILDHSDYRNKLYVEVDKTDAQTQEKLLHYFAQILPEDHNLCRYHIIHAGNQRNTALAIPALEKMRDESYPFFLAGEAYWDSLLTLDISINSYMTDVGIYDWMDHAKKLLDLSSPAVCEKIGLCLIRGLEESDLRCLYVSALLAEKKLLVKEEILLRSQKSVNADDISFTAGQVWEELCQLSQYWVACAATLYKDEVFMSGLIQALPPTCRFGWFIMQANAMKASNHVLYLQKIADAAKAYPALKELCKMVIRAG